MGELLTAFSGAKRSETDGRTVIDKLYGLKTNEQGVAIGSGALNPTFAGSDRPEFHKTLDGFEQVCVEKETENLAPNLGTDYTYTNCVRSDQGVGISEVTADSGVDQFVYFSASSLFTDGQDGCRAIDVKYVNYRYVRISTRTLPNGSTDRAHVDFDLIDKEVAGASGGLIITVEGVVEKADGWLRIFFSVPANTSTVSQAFGIAFSNAESLGMDILTTQDFVGDEKILFSKPQPEVSKYPTLFTEGTRLAPLPVIDDALPDKGAVAGVLDTVKVSFARVFQTVSVTTELRFSGDNFRVRFNAGTNHDFNIPFSWNENESKKMCFALSWGKSVSYLYIFHDNTIYEFEILEEVTSISQKTVALGGATISSSKFEKFELIEGLSEIVDKSSFFEDLTKGTSQEIKASEITIA